VVFSGESVIWGDEELIKRRKVVSSGVQLAASPRAGTDLVLFDSLVRNLRPL